MARRRKPHSERQVDTISKIPKPHGTAHAIEDRKFPPTRHLLHPLLLRLHNVNDGGDRPILSLHQMMPVLLGMKILLHSLPTFLTLVITRSISRLPVNQMANIFLRHLCRHILRHLAPHALCQPVKPYLADIVDHLALAPMPPRAPHAEREPQDVWTFFEPVGPNGKEGRECMFCRQQHATTPHVKTPVFSPKTRCKQLSIEMKAKEAVEYIKRHRPPSEHNHADDSEAEAARVPFSNEAFIDAIVEFMVADDQSISVIENKQLRKIFLMLRSELKDYDIPHRTKIRERVMEVWEEHLKTLETEMGNAIGKISATMDLWTDLQKIPYMVVTAHWLEAKLITTPSGPQYTLALRTDLIGFMRVPGHHTGEHLATAFLHIIDRIRIDRKLGWVMLDNASKNDTFMIFLERELTRRGISFRRSERRIRCFPHIVNLACKAVLSAIINTEFAAPEASDFVPLADEATTSVDAIKRDPVATIRSTVRVIRASSLRRQYFSEVLKALKQKDLQLLRDVDTRWSSTLLMIERAVLLREAIDEFLSDDQFADLQKYTLGDEEWNALKAFQRILAVPHAFQHWLYSEATPTLGNAIPSFQAMIKACLDAYEILGLDTPQRPEHSQSLAEEVNMYFMEGVYRLGSIRCWEENQLRYPTIFASALDVLPVQGSAVPCERVFSSAGETDTPRRNRTAPDLMEGLQMLKFSVKKGRGLNFTAGTSKEAELAALEAQMAAASVVPEDTTGFTSFINSLLAQE
ncbi:HAT family dimerization domain-containing protein [Mycena venus]|uniref:HAT family dimerization domain-containing protein n=1 Tax=Mycena venus TaxID=2733690 RepID=A0A8H6X3W0_9AGAR|nr:HAT family dimerization domain-containing protein [Mycena venus]